MSAQAFIAFLRAEAIQAEERARHLRATAAAIEANSPYDGMMWGCWVHTFSAVSHTNLFVISRHRWQPKKAQTRIH
jgi:hypothetical protein